MANTDPIQDLATRIEADNPDFVVNPTTVGEKVLVIKYEDGDTVDFWVGQDEHGLFLGDDWANEKETRGADAIAAEINDLLSEPRPEFPRPVPHPEPAENGPYLNEAVAALIVQICDEWEDSCTSDTIEDKIATMFRTTDDEAQRIWSAIRQEIHQLQD